jgi:hypothetical protein
MILKETKTVIGSPLLRIRPVDFARGPLLEWELDKNFRNMSMQDDVAF